MAAVFDIAEMKQRVAATGSKLSAAAQGERERSSELLQHLEAVEKTLVQNQQQIRRLEERQGRTLDEFEQLRDPLHDTLIGPPHLLWRCFSPKSFAARADLIVKLDAINAMRNPGGEEGADGECAKEAGTARVIKRSGKVLAFSGLIVSLIAVALVAYQMHGETMSTALNDTLLPSRSGKGSIETAAAIPGRPLDPVQQSDAAMVENNLEEDPVRLHDGPEKGDAATVESKSAEGPAGLRDGSEKGDAALVESKSAEDPVGLRDGTEKVDAAVQFALGAEPRPKYSLEQVLDISQDKLSDAAVAPQAPGTESAFAATTPYINEESVSQWLEVAQRQLSDMALTTPERANAYETYQRVLTIQPDNEAALAGIEQIGVK